MKKIIVCVFALLSIALANEDCSANGLPDKGCYQVGYVCNVGFDVSHENSVLYFNLGTDASCTTLLGSKQYPTYQQGNPSALSVGMKLFLVENEYEVSPLSLTLAGSIALSAANNKMPVEVIYKGVNSIEYGGIRLLSIKYANN